YPKDDWLAAGRNAVARRSRRRILHRPAGWVARVLGNTVQEFREGLRLPGARPQDRHAHHGGERRIAIEPAPSLRAPPREPLHRSHAELQPQLPGDLLAG